MENQPEIIRLLPFAEKYLKELPPAQQAMVAADIDDMRTRNLATVHTKQLSGPIRELIVGNHRFTHFRLQDTIYFVRGFRKKTVKTPLSEIEYANRIYKMMKSNI